MVLLMVFLIALSAKTHFAYSPAKDAFETPCFNGAKTHLIRATLLSRGGWAVSLYALLIQR